MHILAFRELEFEGGGPAAPDTAELARLAATALLGLAQIGDPCGMRFVEAATASRTKDRRRLLALLLEIDERWPEEVLLWPTTDRPTTDVLILIGIVDVLSEMLTEVG